MTTRQRRTSANPGNFAIETDDDRVYTEDDYAEKPSASQAEEWADGNAAYAQSGWTTDAPLPDEAFQPDEEDLPPADFPEEEYYPEETYPPLFTSNDDFTEDIDPLSEELLTDEERAELRRSHWQLLAGLADFAGVILGTAAILVIVTLLVSLLNWLVSDLSQSFILLQKHL